MTSFNGINQENTCFSTSSLKRISISLRDNHYFFLCKELFDDLHSYDIFSGYVIFTFYEYEIDNFSSLILCETGQNIIQSTISNQNESFIIFKKHFILCHDKIF